MENTSTAENINQFNFSTLDKIPQELTEEYGFDQSLEYDPIFSDSAKFTTVSNRFGIIAIANEKKISIWKICKDISSKHPLLTIQINGDSITSICINDYFPDLIIGTTKSVIVRSILNTREPHKYLINSHVHRIISLNNSPLIVDLFALILRIMK